MSKDLQNHQANCPFCKIIEGKDPNALVVWENDFVICFLPLKMEVEGHLLVVPKDHFENIFDIDEKNIAEIGKALRFVAITLKNFYNVDGVNILNANGESAGQSVFHLHFHIMPRYKSDNLDLWPEIPEKKFNKNKIHHELSHKFYSAKNS